jgi:cysteinyl-tRNA synthetase
LSELAMTSLATDEHRAKLEQARQARYARAITNLRKARRMEQRAERQLLRAWQRADAIRESLEAR